MPSVPEIFRSFLIVAVLATASCAASSGGAGAQAPSVEVVYGEWRDDARDRVVPYKFYLPSSHAAAPVVIFSHGLGGSREAAGYLLEYLAANGIAAVAIQHPGTDESLLRDGAETRQRQAPRLQLGAADTAAGAVARFGDVRFVINRLEAENRSGPLAGRFDLSHIGMSGHSYGALTTLVAVGQRLASGSEAFRDARIDAAIVYSPNAPRNQDAATALADVHTPILHFTGTEDRSRFDLEPTPEGRQIPFRTISGADQYLIVFDGGEHMIYSGRVQSRGGMTEAQRAQTEAILRESLTFWRAYLLQDANALAALCAIPSRVDSIGVGEVKAPRCAAR
jgi:predicted dienelactone hydrolase